MITLIITWLRPKFTCYSHIINITFATMLEDVEFVYRIFYG